MFLEISAVIFNKVKKILEKYGISYQISDCTLPGELMKMYHIDFSDNLSKAQISEINKVIDEAYKEEKEKTKSTELPIIDIDVELENKSVGKDYDNYENEQ